MICGGVQDLQVRVWASWVGVDGSSGSSTGSSSARSSASSSGSSSGSSRVAVAVAIGLLPVMPAAAAFNPALNSEAS